VEFLFSLETNEGFGCEPVALDGVMEAVAAGFGITAITSAMRVEKRNALSTIDFLTTDQGRFVLRASAADTCEALALQCRIVNELGVATVQPLTNADGAFVTRMEGQSWVVYPYIDGPLFVSETFGVLDAVRAALDFQVALGDWQKRYGEHGVVLNTVSRDPDDWGGLANRLLRGDEGLTTNGRTFVEKFRSDFVRLSGLARTAHPGEVGLAHSDLQHANVVVTKSGPAIIDLEDICLDSPAVCAAHAIFKMVRHAVYIGLMDVGQARSEVIVPAIAYAHTLGLIGANELLATGALAALRTLGDIHNILTLMDDPATAWVSYDLEKKVQNVFEIDVLFSTGDAV